ncbi:MAG TPA: carotenoid biosynthesis protein [Solirubrobacteraceae bacterium]|nr:carotenoid biosynthesis protein [Solirubrobacteraceae bacterium]
MRRLFGALFGALVVTQLFYGKLARLRTPAGTKAIVALLLGASSAEAVAARGRARATALVGSAAAIGFAAELAGVATGQPFGHYAYSSLLGRKVGGVPLAAAAAWAMMARPSWVVAGLVTRRRVARVGLAAGALTAWDVFLDPRMAREGYWSWPGGGRYEGIPASNFLGWLVTGAGVFCVWSLIDGDDDPLHDGDGALALYTWTWLGELVANLFIWKRPRVAAAGGLAMGVVVVPALLARGRRAS